MKMPSQEQLDDLWARHHAQWRDTAQIASQWHDATLVDRRLLQCHVDGAWWDILAEHDITLLVTREYEHLVMALNAQRVPHISYLSMPHPSGLAVDQERGTVYIASTRNPNQVYDLAPVTSVLPRSDVIGAMPEGRPLVPVRSRFFPGCLYMHDLALVGGALYANAVGQNAIVRLQDNGSYEHVWWPRCIDTSAGPLFGRNYLQLNSIAGAESLEESYFSASTDKITSRRPGHKNFAVNRRGVIFSGRTRDPVAYGLTRPHSARLYRNRLWVDDSGYGEMGFIEDQRFIPLVRLPGWTRGLCFHGRVVFVGTSRVIPRFRQYAPGLDVDRSLCAVHAIDIESGKVLGSIVWPFGNQIFAIDWVPGSFSSGFPFDAGVKHATARHKKLFYTFVTQS